ncbi:MAG: hypothetical protein IPM46_07525 [Flavobacteriales bacterium]|nr:hypothetical protein [Flavobacteriales bacterium]
MDITLLNDRRLLGYRFANPSGFYMIDTLTGSASILAATNSVADVVAMETESDSTILFAKSWDPQLYRLHLITLAVSVVGNMASYPGGDLLLLGNQLFYTTQSNALRRIDLTPDHQSISQMLHIGWLTVPNVWGLALPSGFMDEYPDCILATAGQQLYALNTVTAEVTEICDMSVTGSFYGAAAIRDETTSNPNMYVTDSGPCSWHPQPSTLLIGAEGVAEAVKAWLPSTHTLIEWNLFDAVGRYIAGARGATMDDNRQFNHGWYILRAMVQDPCGREILVPGIRLRM